MAGRRQAMEEGARPTAAGNSLARLASARPWMASLDLAVCAVLVLLASLAFIALPEGSLLRLALGLTVLFFAPGYLLIEACAGPAESRHVEHRICGADANLYLAVATVLGAAAHGMRERLDPGPPVVGNGYREGGARALPGTRHQALELAASSEFLEDALGKEFLKIYLSIKQQECARVSAEVSELDYGWYLRS